MGWGNCGTDSKGRGIGYCWPAMCDHPGCSNEIDRGLAYACGGMHGEGECMGGSDTAGFEWVDCSCENYFCSEHRTNLVFEHEDGTEIWSPELCITCAAIFDQQYKNDPDMWPTESPLIGYEEEE